MDFQELIKQTKKVHRKFPRKWDKKTQFINLVEEIGELANAILLKSSDKPEKRRRADLEDSFADLLFALIVTAEEYEIDLEKSLKQTLDAIEKRQKKGEYSDE